MRAILVGLVVLVSACSMIGTEPKGATPSQVCSIDSVPPSPIGRWVNTSNSFDTLVVASAGTWREGPLDAGTWFVDQFGVEFMEVDALLYWDGVVSASQMHVDPGVTFRRVSIGCR